jgi:hypothetical protein
MSWKPHQITNRRKMITLQEWAVYIGVSKNTVIAWMKRYTKEQYAYDPRNIYSVFNFLIYALIQKYAPLLDFLKFLLHRKFPADSEM